MSKNGTVTAEEAKQAIALERHERAQNCMNEIVAILEKYNCDMRAKVVIYGNQIVSNVEVLAND